MSALSLLSEREVADTLKCSTRTVQRLRESGKLAFYEGRPVLIDAADLKKYLESRKRRLTPTSTGRTSEEIALLARQIALREVMARKRK